MDQPIIQFSYETRQVLDAVTQRYEDIYRPVAKLRITGPSGSRVLAALVDTGADETLFPYDVATSLGLVIRDDHRDEIRGLVGDSMIICYCTVSLEVVTPGGGPRWSARVGFYLGARPILGHAGFLNHFTAKFNGRAKTLTLPPNGTAPVVVIFPSL